MSAGESGTAMLGHSACSSPTASTTSLGPRWASTLARSSAVRRGLSGTTVAPDFQPPQSATAKDQRLGMESAIRSPDFIPRSARERANPPA